MNKTLYEIFRLYGIVTDIEPVELMNGASVPGVPTPAVWTNGKNVYFDNGATKRVPGYATFAAPLPAGADPIFQLNVLSPTQAWWVWVDGQTPGTPKVYVTEGTSHADITPAAGLTGGGVGEWTGTVLNGVPVLNNGKDAPIWWDGVTANPMTDLPDWPANTTAKSVRAYKYHLIAMNVTENGNHIQEFYRWSAAADPGTIPQSWTPEPGNDAGFNTLSATPGGIVDGAKLRDSFCIYKQHSTYLMQYIAGQYVFTVRPLFTTLGMQALNCVQELRGSHYVFADDDVVVHDGQSFKSIIDRKNRKILFDAIEPTNQKACHMAARVSTDEIYINSPTTTGVRCTHCLVYSYSEDQWGFRDLPNVAFMSAGIVPNQGIPPTWADAPYTWENDPRWWNEAAYSASNDQLLMSGNNKLYEVDAAVDNDGQAVEAYVERLNWTIHGQEHIWQNDYVRSIYPVFTGTAGQVIKVRMGGTRGASQPVEWQPEQELIIGGSNKIDIITHGRYLNMRFSSSGGNPWELHRIGIEFSPAGKF